MDIFSTLLIAIGLAADAFAVSVSCGITSKTPSIKQAVNIGLTFGLFQGIMPMIGWFIGCSLNRFIEPIDHWTAFGFLAFIGVNMILNGLKHKERPFLEAENRMLLGLAFATSIDALATGVSVSILKHSVIMLSIVTSLITACACFIGVRIGHCMGVKSSLSEKLEMIGGGLLILIGLKILVEHLGLF